MRSVSVVVLPPSFKLFPHILHGEEEVVIETFVSQPPVEALDKIVLHGLDRSDEVELHLVFIRPGIHGLAIELGAIINGDRLRQSAFFYEEKSLRERSNW